MSTISDDFSIMDWNFDPQQSDSSRSSFHKYQHAETEDGSSIIADGSCSKFENLPQPPFPDEEDYLDEEINIIYDSDEEMVQGSQNDPSAHANERALSGLEHITLTFLEQLLAGTKQIELTLANRLKVQNDGTKILRWPKRNIKGSFRRFACLFRVIDLISEALTTNTPTTKRDIYYKDVPLFKSQYVVDELVDDLAATIGVTRTDLNVRASPKGLFCGSSLTIFLRRGGLIRGNDVEGALIPAGSEVSGLEIDEKVSWVLVVEKEAVFQTLCGAGTSSNPSCPGPGIIITGKGYPDLATRELVSRLSHTLPSIPILALVDADPYGLDILSVYKFGSQSLSHEGSKTMAPRIVWLGLCAGELSSLGIDRDQLILLTKHDHKKGLEMLRRSDAVMPPQWRKEISFMLHIRRKAEIEIISSAFSLKRQSSISQHSLLQDIFQDKDAPAAEVEPPLVQYVFAKLQLRVKAI